MSRIYKITDRIEIQIHDLKVKIAPLSLSQKSEVQALMLEGQKKQDLQLLNNAIYQAIKFCLKDIKGLEDSSGESYQLSFDNGQLSDGCLEDLTNMEHSKELIEVCSSFVSGIPKGFSIEGVSIVSNEGKK